MKLSSYDSRAGESAPPNSTPTHWLELPSLSLSGKTSPFRFLARLLRLRCSVLLRSLCASEPPQPGERSTASLSPERQEIATPAFPIVSPHCLPVAPDCELSIPLERLRLETHRLALPRWRSLGNFQNRRSTPLFGLSAFRDPFPHAGGQPKRSIPLTASEISKRAGDARQSCFMPALGPGMNHASRAAPR